MKFIFKHLLKNLTKMKDKIISLFAYESEIKFSDIQKRLKLQLKFAFILDESPSSEGLS